MGKVNIREAELEREDDDAIMCRTCNSPAEDEFEPYCMSCGMYWRDCINGLWDDAVQIDPVERGSQ
jgi:hypothetical protein